jgi:hypothetical protein
MLSIMGSNCVVSFKGLNEILMFSMMSCFVGFISGFNYQWFKL